MTCFSNFTSQQLQKSSAITGQSRLYVISPLQANCIEPYSDTRSQTWYYCWLNINQPDRQMFDNTLRTKPRRYQRTGGNNFGDADTFLVRLSTLFVKPEVQLRVKQVQAQHLTLKYFTPVSIQPLHMIHFNIALPSTYRPPNSLASLLALYSVNAAHMELYLFYHHIDISEIVQLIYTILQCSTSYILVPMIREQVSFS